MVANVYCLFYGRHRAKHLTHIIHLFSSSRRTGEISILQMRRLRFREMDWFARIWTQASDAKIYYLLPLQY